MMNDQFIILLVEDNPADVRLTQDALLSGEVIHELHVVKDGVEAMAFLRHDEPYTQMPRPDLARIPVIVLTTSQADEDIIRAYDLYANGYIIKPVDIEQFFATIKNLKEFWMEIVMLPPKESG